MSYHLWNIASVPRLTLTLENLEANPAGGRHELLVQLARRWSEARPPSILTFREYDQYRVKCGHSLAERIAAYDEELSRYHTRLCELRTQAGEIAALAETEGIDDSIVVQLPERAAALVTECEQRLAAWSEEKRSLLREPEEVGLDLSDVIAQARNLLAACR
jgi:hypothetical protein